MAKKPSERRNYQETEMELNLTPMMNLIAILIPVLLVSTAFVEIAVINVSAPAIGSAPENPEPDRPPDKPPLNLTITVTDKGYTVAVLTIEEGSWLAGRTLRDSELADEGILVLNITRSSGLVIATPASRTEVHPGDEILTYGLEEDIAHLRDRIAGDPGDRAHKKAVERQRLRLAEERVEDAIAERVEEGREESAVSD